MAQPNLKTDKLSISLFGSKKKEEDRLERNAVVRPRYNTFTKALLGTGAAGAGAYGLSQFMLSDSDKQKIQDGISKVKEIPQGTQTGFTKYVEALSPMAGVKSFGLTVPWVMPRFRANKDLMDLVGAGGAYSPGPLRMREMEQHYQDFAEGAIPAYYHLFDYKDLGKLPDHLQDKVLAPNDRYGELMRAKFNEYIRKRLVAQDSLYPGKSTWIDPSRVTKDLVPQDTQMQWLKEFGAELSPELQEYRKQVETLSGDLPEAISLYANGAEVFMKPRDKMKQVGITLGGTAAGGLIGQQLASRLWQGDDKAKRNAGIVGGVGGAGLGGLLSYFYAMDPEKRNQLLEQVKTKFIDKVKTMLQKKSSQQPFGLSQLMPSWSSKEETPEEKRRKTKKKNNNLLTTAAGGTAAAGAGLYGIAHAMASQNDVDVVRAARKDLIPGAFLDNSLLPPNETGLTHYQKALTGAANLSPFGIPIKNWMAAIRSDRDLLTALNVSQDFYMNPDNYYDVSGLPHYESFAAGPVRAYVHQMKARLRDNIVPEELAGQAGRTYASWMGDKFEDFVKSRAKGLNPFEVTLEGYPRDVQLQMMEDFHKSLSPAEQAYRREMEIGGEARVNQITNYLPPAEQVIGIRNKILDAGKVVGGAGAGGLLGNLLYRAFRDPKKDRSTLLESLSTATGAGLGGAASYFLGTEKGKETLSKALTLLKHKALGAVTGKKFSNEQLINLQQYMPTGQRRELTPEEELQFQRSKSNWLPELFPSFATKPHQLVSSPTRSAVMGGLLGGAASGLVGGMMGRSIDNASANISFNRQGMPEISYPGGYTGTVAGAAVGALGGGLVSALLAYISRRQKNEDIEELTRRNAPGATYRDLLSDPVYQSQRQPTNANSYQASGNLAAMLAANQAASQFSR